MFDFYTNYSIFPIIEDIIITYRLMSFKIFIYFELLNINFTTFKDFVLYKMWFSDLFKFLEDDMFVVCSSYFTTLPKYFIS